MNDEMPEWVRSAIAEHRRVKEGGSGVHYPVTLWLADRLAQAERERDEAEAMRKAWEKSYWAYAMAVEDQWNARDGARPDPTTRRPPTPEQEAKA